MSEIARIAAELRRMYEGPAWHGPSVSESVAGITAAQASARPLVGGHTIYELTHHIAAWIGEARSRLLGNRSGDPADGDWPPPNARIDQAAWREALARLAERQSEMLEALSGFDPARLGEIVDPDSPSAEGRRVTHYILLHGLVQHNAYHAGQIMLLRRALGL